MEEQDAPKRRPFEQDAPKRRPLEKAYVIGNPKSGTGGVR
jgi:hypothetical protein